MWFGCHDQKPFHLNCVCSSFTIGSTTRRVSIFVLHLLSFFLLQRRCVVFALMKKRMPERMQCAWRYKWNHFMCIAINSSLTIDIYGLFFAWSTHLAPRGLLLTIFDSQTKNYQFNVSLLTFDDVEQWKLVNFQS